MLREAPSLNIQDQTATDYWLEKWGLYQFDYLTLVGTCLWGNLRKICKKRTAFGFRKYLATITGYSGLTPMINSSIGK